MSSNKHTLPDNYLDYPERHYGMDHDRYTWSMLQSRKAVTWPNNASLAVWVNVAVQYFPLNQQGVPFKVPGGMTMPYPDLRHYSLRDYGNRVGIFRFLKAFDKYGITPTFALNTRLAERTPYLLDALKERGNEILCHGYHMDALHYSGQAFEDEDVLIEKALTKLNELSGQNIKGWISPARNESENTADLLAKHGIEYFCDWVNDDMPYRYKTAKKPLIAMPLSNELEDRFVIVNNQHSEQSWSEQVCDACDFLLEEAKTQGGRILALNIHPWLLGQPHRIQFLEDTLAYIMSKPGVWSASATDIANSWQQQNPD
ncbi:polysaccharide deacetylase family protein [Paraglaciecola sp. 2405UD69-4]|uniref:polysaccharide deacetylase family protein n=1 Tax=Paraglaciecola sp. 2405UD69-4 TaxID=3391836 RepID=UPI0039C94F70